MEHGCPMSTKTTFDRTFIFIFAAYSSGLVIANAMGAKLMAFGPWLLSVGTIAYPLTFVLQDVINERNGKEASRVAVLGAAVALTCLAACSYVATLVHDPTQPHMDKAFASIFGFAPKIVLASIVAFIIGGLVDTHIFFAIRARWPSSLIVRKVGSTIVSQIVDTAVFVSIAFFGLEFKTMLAIWIGQYLFKLIAAFVNVPITYLLVRLLP